MPYASEEAFRAGLRARLSAEARTNRFSRDELAQTVTLQLFLARLFRSPDADQWILTGGTALHFRAPTQARPTTDMLLPPEMLSPHPVLTLDEPNPMPVIRLQAVADKVAALYELTGPHGDTPDPRPLRLT